MDLLNLAWVKFLQETSLIWSPLKNTKTLDPCVTFVPIDSTATPETFNDKGFMRRKLLVFDDVTAP